MFGLLAARSRWNHSQLVAGDPYWSNVVSLLHFDGANGDTTFADATGKTWTPFGDVQLVSEKSKFGSTSAYFSGSNCGLRCTDAAFNLGTGDFTLEWWLWRAGNTVTNNDAVILDARLSDPSTALDLGCGGTNSGSTAGQIKLWINGAFALLSSANIGASFSHVALCRAAGVTRIFINGISSATVYNDTNNYSSTSWTLGARFAAAGGDYRSFNGYMDEFRATKGVARYTSNFTPPTSAYPDVATTDPLWTQVASLMHFNGADGSATFTDQKGIVWAAGGNARLSTAKGKFGTSSGYFDGVGDYARTPAAGFDFGSGDFTIEAFVNPDTITSANQYRGIITQRTNINSFAFGVFQTQSNGGFSATFSETGNGNAVVLGPSGAISAGTWYHVAVTRQGNTWRLFVDGVLVSTATASVAIYGGLNFANIGVLDDGGTNSANCFKGYVEEVRVTKGTARYTADFTPPTAPFPNQ